MITASTRVNDTTISDDGADELVSAPLTASRAPVGVSARSLAHVEDTVLHDHRLPEELIDEKTIRGQHHRCNHDLETHLHRNGTKIVKIFLHLSKAEQANRLRARIDAPDKNWKYSLADIHERTYWEQYMQAYQACLNATSTDTAPWYVVPADDKQNARLIVSQIVLDTFADLKMSYPQTTLKRHQQLEALRGQL